MAFFSQTGTEIVELNKLTGIKPSLIITNNIDESKHKINPNLKKISSIMYARHDNIMEYLRSSNFYSPNNTVITLHGYLRILPSDICNKFRIYNGHPGAIDLYPELKGFNPQQRAWEEKEKYKFIGSVIHKVISEVDEGKIVKSVHVTNRSYNIDDMFSSLRMTSLAAWSFALKEILCVSE